MSATLSPDMVHIDSEVVELTLLLPRGLAESLEDAAEKRGLTAGQLLRRMIASTIAPAKQAASA